MSAEVICHLAAATHLGGAERSMLELLRAQAAAGARRRAFVILPKPDGPLVDALTDARIDHDVLPMPARVLRLSRSTPAASLGLALAATPELVRYGARLRRLFGALRPALLHTNGVKPHLLSALAPRRLPILWHVRDIFDRGPARLLLRALGRARPVSIVAVSRAAATALDAPRPRVAVAHDGLDPAIYHARPNRDFHRALGLDGDTPLVGILGVLARGKGQLEFLEMAARLRARGVAARFVVIGDQIYDSRGDAGFGARLRRHARALGLERHVHFAGFRADAVRAINGLDVLVHASTAPEGFGRVVVEAMACGVPVVASGAWGVTEIVDDGVTGLLAPPGDVARLTEAVARLLAEPALRRALAERARAVFLERFTIQKHVRTLERIYDGILS